MLHQVQINQSWIWSYDVALCHPTASAVGGTHDSGMSLVLNGKEVQAMMKCLISKQAHSPDSHRDSLQNDDGALATTEKWYNTAPTITQASIIIGHDVWIIVLAAPPIKVPITLHKYSASSYERQSHYKRHVILITWIGAILPDSERGWWRGWRWYAIIIKYGTAPNNTRSNSSLSGTSYSAPSPDSDRGLWQRWL